MAFVNDKWQIYAEVCAMMYGDGRVLNYMSPVMLIAVNHARPNQFPCIGYSAAVSE